MKKHIWVLVFLIGMISACENSIDEDPIPLSVNNLIGKWQLSETYISPGGATEWRDVQDGIIYEFKTNGDYAEFNAVEDTYSTFGVYRIEDTTLWLEYTMEQELITQGFNIEITETTITLSPSYPTICIEACLSRFKKIN